jgi:hypothetical protein
MQVIILRGWNTFFVEKPLSFEFLDSSGIRRGIIV